MQYWLSEKMKYFINIYPENMMILHDLLRSLHKQKFHRVGPTGKNVPHKSVAIDRTSISSGRENTAPWRIKIFNVICALILKYYFTPASTVNRNPEKIVTRRDMSFFAHKWSTFFCHGRSICALFLTETEVGSSAMLSWATVL